MTRSRGGEVADRLMEYASQNQAKIEMRKQKSMKTMFKPQISEKSRELASGLKNGELKKVQNGKSKNVEYWLAEPKNTKNIFLTSDIRALKKKKRAVQSRKRKKMKNKENKSPVRPSRSPTPGKKDWCPNYLSPYTRELVVSEVPLKTLIARTSKLNGKKPKAMKKQSVGAGIENDQALNHMNEQGMSQACEIPLKRGVLTPRKGHSEN